MFGASDNDRAASSFNSKLVQSPYLGIDPNYLQKADEFIVLDDAGAVRSRVQVMFSMVGGATVCGAALGGLESIRYTGLQLLRGKSERIQMTSAVLKNGGRIASRFGSIAVLYYVGSILSEKARGVEDEINTLVGGGAAGALFSLPNVLSVKKSAAQSQASLGLFRRNFMLLPPVGRLAASTLLGLAAGGLISLYKTQATDYIQRLTKQTWLVESLVWVVLFLVHLPVFEK